METVPCRHSAKNTYRLNAAKGLKVLSKFLKWFDERWPFKAVIRYSLTEEIPGGDSFWYCFGAVTLFIFMIQVVTGIWQLFFYVPTVDHAYQSVSYIRQQVPFGWFIHGLHYWGSNAFIVIIVIHMLRAFVWGAYKYPRQLTWLAGVLLFFLAMALSFTGALLPWDELGYWAAEVGTSIAGTVPIFGFFIKEFLRGGAGMDQATLSRFFVLHVAILPGILAGLIAFHVIAFRQFKSVGPWNPEKSKKTGFFWPNQILKDMIVVSILFLILAGLIVFWRAPVTGPADPIDNSITPKPEWQFLFLYQFLKLFKGPWEPVGTVGIPLVLFLILFLLPFYDRNKQRNPLRRPLAMLACIALIGWFIVYTILGYLSNPGANLTAPVAVSSQASTSVKAGAKLFSSQGCLACHTIGGQGGDVGPNLSNEASRGHSNDWLQKQIRDPKAHNPSTAMPAFSSLSDKQVNALVDFLQSQGGNSKKAAPTAAPSDQQTHDAAPPKESKSAAGDPNTPSKTTTHPDDSEKASSQTKQTDPNTSLVSRGKSLFSSESCIGCHKVDGQGGSVGPDLSGIGNAGHTQQWLTVQIQNPKEHDAKTTMPPFNSLSDPKIKALVAYLESLKGKSGSQNSGSESSSTNQKSTASANEPPSSLGNNFSKVGTAAYFVGNPPHGEKLYSKQCSQCHGKDGKGGISNPGSVSGDVPALNPIVKSLFSAHPVTFAENIDRYIQHGSIPKGTHPEKIMPAFGDDLTLTQEMIAQIEAYVLELNNVDRSMILQPGVKPGTFFAITILAYAIAGLVIVFVDFWSKTGRPEPAQTASDVSSEKPAATDNGIQPRTETSTSGSDEKISENMQIHPQTQSLQKQRLNSIYFTLFVIALIIVIATCVMLVFSSFVTAKPIPSMVTLKIASEHSKASQQTEESPENSNSPSNETRDNTNMTDAAER